jgi:hypothetical protein
MQALDSDVPHLEVITVVQPYRPVRSREVVPPVGAALVGEIEPGAGLGRQLAAAGDEVGVNVGFGDVGDAEVQRSGEGQVLLDVAGGIDDQRLPRLATADEIPGLCELRIPDAVQEH